MDNSLLILILLPIYIAVLVYSSFLLSGKKLYSPSFLLNCIFLVCSIASAIGNSMFWHESISYRGPFLIAIGLTLITLAEYGINLLLKWLNRNKPSKEIKPVEKFSFNYRTIILFGVLSVFGIAVNLIYFKYSLDAIIPLGYHPFDLNIYYFLRRIVLEGANFPAWLTLLNNIVRGAGLACVFFFVYSIYGLKKKRQLLYLVLPIINLLVSFLISTARDVFILTGVVGLFSYFVTVQKRKEKYSLLEIFLVSLLVVEAFIAIYCLIGLSRERVSSRFFSNILKTITTYSGSSIVCFDKWLQLVPSWSTNTPFGAESFSGVYYFLNKIFGDTIPSGTFVLEHLSFLNGSGSNIYTMFRSFYADFGLIGNFILPIFIGAGYGILFFYLKRKPENSLLLFYGSLLTFYLVYGAFTPIVTSSILSISRLLYIVVGSLTIWGIKVTIYGLPQKQESESNTSSKKVFKKNVSYALIAEAIAVVVGAIVSLLLPKVVSDDAYSYYHLFTFYIGFVGLAHLGYCDGVYLRFGGKTTDDFKKNNIKTQLIVFWIIELVFAVFVALGSLFFVSSSIERALIMIFVAIYLVVYNSVIFIGYIFQDVNQTSIYSKAIIISKLFFFVCLIGLFVMRVVSPFPYIICFTLGYIAALIYLLIKGRKFLFGKPEKFKLAISDMAVSIKCGVILLFAGLSNAMILGITRYVIDWRWGLSTFGKLSFALSLVALISAFFTSFSLVLFPSLRLRNDDDVDVFFENTQKVLSILLPLSYLLFFLLVLFVNWWLPSYSESLIYFALMLPMVIFNAKYTTICRTAMNVDREEKKLLLTNLISMCVSIVFTVVSAYALSNAVLTVLSATIGTATLAILGQFLSKRKNKNALIKASILDIALAASFILINQLLNIMWLKVVITLALLIAYYVILYKDVSWFIKTLAERAKNNKQSKEKN